MTNSMHWHMRRLYWMHAGALFLVAAAALVASLARSTDTPPLGQADAVLGVLGTLGAINLLTIQPVLRAMIASPRRVFAVSAEADPLLQAHLVAQAIALLRGVALAGLGLAALYLAGRSDWAWILEASAVLAMILLWPRRRTIRALLGVPL